MHAYAGRQFVPFLWWSLVWPGREANSRPTVREADTLPTEPNQHGQWNHKSIRVLYVLPRYIFQPDYCITSMACFLLWWIFLILSICTWIKWDYWSCSWKCLQSGLISPMCDCVQITLAFVIPFGCTWLWLGNKGGNIRPKTLKYPPRE